MCCASAADGTGERFMDGRDRKRAAQSLVEFALIAPLFLAMLFIIIELGIVFSIYIGLTNAAREGARAGAVFHIDNPETYQNTAFVTARTAIDGQRATAVGSAINATNHPMVGALTPVITYNETSATNGTNIYRYGEKMTVTLSFNHTFFFGLFSSDTLTIQAHSEMVLEPGGL